MSSLQAVASTFKHKAKELIYRKKDIRHEDKKIRSYRLSKSFFGFFPLSFGKTERSRQIHKINVCSLHFF